MHSIYMVVILALVVSSNAWVSTKPFKGVDGDFDGYCHGTDADNLGKMKVGETRQLTAICGVAKCAGNGDIHYSGCGKTAAAPPCKVVNGNEKDLYPACCEQVECPNNNL